MILTLYLDFYTYMNIFVGQIPRSEIESVIYLKNIDGYFWFSLQKNCVSLSIYKNAFSFLW